MVNYSGHSDQKLNSKTFISRTEIRRPVQSETIPRVESDKAIRHFTLSNSKYP